MKVERGEGGGEGLGGWAGGRGGMGGGDYASYGFAVPIVFVISPVLHLPFCIYWFINIAATSVCCSQYITEIEFY